MIQIVVFIQVLKTHTKEVLYEKYRTEKLLARRATRNISEDERHRLLEGMLTFPFIYSCNLPLLRSRLVIYRLIWFHCVLFLIIPFKFPVFCQYLLDLLLRLFLSSGRNLHAVGEQ
jgi:hypothetical protein